MRRRMCGPRKVRRSSGPTTRWIRSGSATKAWAISFVERFPKDPLSAELQARLKLGTRIQSDVTGGNSTCYASRI